MEECGDRRPERDHAKSLNRMNHSLSWRCRYCVSACGATPIMVFPRGRSINWFWSIVRSTEVTFSYILRADWKQGSSFYLLV